MNDINGGYKALFFDLDGTLVRTASGGTFRNGAQDWEFMPGRKERVRQFVDGGTKVAIVTNQGGVAYGYYTLAEIAKEVALAAELIGAHEAQCCPFHPLGSVPAFARDSWFRKPGPGMLIKAMLNVQVAPRDVLMVGDRPEDEAAAQAACCDFMHADKFFAGVGQ